MGPIEAKSGSIFIKHTVSPMPSGVFYRYVKLFCEPQNNLK